MYTVEILTKLKKIVLEDLSLEDKKHLIKHIRTTIEDKGVLTVDYRSINYILPYKILLESIVIISKQK